MSKRPDEIHPPDACVKCTGGSGWLVENGAKAARKTHFTPNAVGYRIDGASQWRGQSAVFLPGKDWAGTYAIADSELENIDPTKTGKPRVGEEHDNYICNICFVLLPKDEFAPNQRDSKGHLVRRPTCKKCRAHMDLKSIPAKEENRWRKNAPRDGSLFRCHICRKYSIVRVNAKIVLDHDHHRGKIRGWLCDSCNTGLGRFKNGATLFKNALAYLGEEDK